MEIGREAFIEECYKWREEYGTTIVNQIKGMGCSCDYSDEHFTLEPAYVRAVRKLFTDWYHEDIIYRGKRIVNWCPHCTTAIADDEAEYVDEAGHLWYLRYPLDRAGGRPGVPGRRPPRAPKRCWATPAWPSIPRTSASGTSWARR